MAKKAREKPRVARTNIAARPLPMFREMTVIAQDPALRTRAGTNGPILMARIKVPAERLVAGPMGYRVQIVDYDSSTQAFHGTHALPETHDDEPDAWRDGDPKILGDFRFHAQNVYALVMSTLARFEHALGRRVDWSFPGHQLNVAPHGMFDANAFYSRRDQALVFGYFAGRGGKDVYTCLSHDVVVHETTHALIDGLRARYLDPSSADQAALHEGLSDVVALLSVFAQPEVLKHLLARADDRSRVPTLTRGELTPAQLRESTLFGLADEMGQELSGVRGEALRQSAKLRPDEHILDLPEFAEPHRRGEVLVAAVLHGFIAAWSARVVDSATLDQKEFTVRRVAEEGADVADALTTMWIRALDYMPPIHVTFGDALSGALTADVEVRPDDSRFELRQHMRESFAAFGIEPAARGGVEAGTWDPAPRDLDFGRVRFESLKTNENEVFRFLWENRDALGLRTGPYTVVLNVRPCTRIGPDGFVLEETVAEYHQVAKLTASELREAGVKAPQEFLDALREARTNAARKQAGGDDEHAFGARDDDEDDQATTPLHGGGVLVFDEYGRLKYHVHNDVFGSEQSARLEYLWNTGQLTPGGDEARLRPARLSTIHRMRALDTRRFPQDGW